MRLRNVLGSHRRPRIFFTWIRHNALKSPNSTKGIQGNARTFPFLLGFAWFYLDRHMRKMQRAKTDGGRRLRSHRGSNLLPEAVRGLGLKSDRFERARGGADQSGFEVARAPSGRLRLDGYASLSRKAEYTLAETRIDRGAAYDRSQRSVMLESVVRKSTCPKLSGSRGHGRRKRCRSR
jgi:hypothetical protein